MTGADSTRRLVYRLLIAVAAAMAVGRILGAVLVYEPDLRDRPWPPTRPRPMPTFSSNDRSRWATVRALVDDGTYVVGRRDGLYKERSAVLPLGAADPLQLAVLCAVSQDYQTRRGDSGIVFEDGWGTVDKVLHPSRMEYYSSKPPLLSTMVAGEYWLLQRAFGWTLKDNPFEVVRVVLLTINVLPFVLYLWLLARLLERYGATDWGRLFVMAAACFGTLLTPFLVTFNNHSIAAVTTLVALYCTLRIYDPGKEPPSPSRSLLYHLTAGLCAGFTVCNELPALAFAAGLFLVLLWRSPARTLLAFAPAAALPLAALLWTNYLALGQLRPAYSEFGGPWYQYEGSHWLVPPGTVKHGIDWAGRNGETKAAYTFHLLFGHHGVFALTPVFLLTAAGLAMGLRRRGRAGEAAEGGEKAQPLPYLFSPACLLLSLVVIGFYIVQSDNYGGWSNGPRWLLWLTPLWLVAALPAADWLGRRRWGRALGLALLALSVLAASYDGWNPWRHPWLYRWMEANGWIAY
jgi:hypothetical protein